MNSSKNYYKKEDQFDGLTWEEETIGLPVTMQTNIMLKTK